MNMYLTELSILWWYRFMSTFDSCSSILSQLKRPVLHECKRMTFLNSHQEQVLRETWKIMKMGMNGLKTKTHIA